MDFLDRILSWGMRAPDRVAHVSATRRMSYGELVGRAATLARELATTLPNDRAPVALVGHREPQLLVGMLGCALANHPYVPIDDALPAPRVARIQEIARVATTLTPDDIDRLAPVGSALPAPLARAGDDRFYIMFTSGSTGEPKGVQVTRGNLAAFIDWMLGEQAFTPGGEVFLNQANFSFDLSVMDTYLSLVTGGTLVSATRDHVADLRALFTLLRETPFTTWVSTPTFAGMCLAEPAFSASMLPRLRRFLFCGEVLPREVARALLARFPSAAVWNTYGPTEATVATTSVRLDHAMVEANDALPVGRAMQGTWVEVVDADGRVVPEGGRGEIVIAGPNVSPGYLGRDDLTRARFTRRHGHRAYRTGDWGRYRGDQLFCEGRMDQQVKLRGYRIELGEIEAHLRDVSGVRDAAVVLVVRDGTPHSLVALLLAEDARGDREALAREAKAALAAQLPAYMVPRRLRVVDRFPMTANGKVDRAALAAEAGAR